MSHSIVGVAPSNPMWVFEANYRLLMKLLPDLDSGKGDFVLSNVQGENDLRVSIRERCKYTTMLLLRKPFRVDEQWLPDLSMSLRVYHDARVVEVTAYQGCERIPPRYAYKPGSRYRPDEKKQINHLLHDLLRFCLHKGYSGFGHVAEAT